VPHLIRVALKHLPDDAAAAAYPFSVPQIRTLSPLDLNAAVTFFVGENGSGKSTLLEGIAVAAELPSIGTSQMEDDVTLGPARLLGAALRLAWTQKSRKGPPRDRASGTTAHRRDNATFAPIHAGSGSAASALPLTAGTACLYRAGSHLEFGWVAEGGGA
jgi:hypothetical protein